MSSGVAECGLTRCSAAAIMAGRGLAWPCACGRWLPVWLPEISLAALMFERRNLDARPNRVWNLRIARLYSVCVSRPRC